MANMFGIEYNTPTEIKSSQIQQFQQAKTKAQDPITLSRIAQQEAIFNLFGSPEVRKAEQDQRIMEQVSKIQKTEGESEFDFQFRQAEELRSIAAGESPELALQANDRILKLRNQQLNQDSLKVSTDDRRFTLEEAKNTALLGKQGWIFERQKDGELRPVRKLSDEQPTEEDLDRFKTLQAENPNLVLGSGLDVLKIENLLTSRGRGGSGINNSTQQKHLEALTATKNFARDVVNLSEGLSQDVEALALGRDAIATSSGLAATADRFEATFLEDFGAEEAKSVKADGDARLARVLDQNGLADATSLAKSRVKAMAYKLAKALDPGGRLSDQDVEMAIEMIIGSGRSSVIEKLLRERLASTYEGIEASIDLAHGGMIFGQVGVREAERLETVMNEARTSIDLFNSGIQEAKKPGRLGIDAPKEPGEPDVPAGNPDPERQRKLAELRARLGQQ